MQEMAIDRVIRMAELTGAQVHIQAVTTREGVRLVREAKAKGLPVSAETCPHYFCLTDAAIETFGTNAKVRPPLREADDIAALKEGIADGAIDAIATQHAPHTLTEKDVEFELAPFGMVGLETALALTLTHLVEPGLIGLSEAIRLLSLNPATILGISAGALGVGAPADVTVFNAGRQWTPTKAALASRSENSPFLDAPLRGAVRYTVCRGEVVYTAE